MNSIFNSMFSCGVLMDFEANLVDVNNKAIDFYKAGTLSHIMNYHTFDFTVNKNKAKYLLDQIITQKELLNQDILLCRFDKTIASVNICAKVLPDINETIFVQFNENIEPCSNKQTDPYVIALFAEVQKLKPYLNKPGQNLLQTISDKHKIKRNEIYNERMSIFIQQYPQLSSTELNICVLISLNISISEISFILGKTPNALRVTIHRIAQKLNVASRTELFKTLATIQ